jgi:hypothetical protein
MTSEGEMPLTKQDLENIENIMDRKLSGFATKDDIKMFATKDDLKNFATKDDLVNLESKMGKMESRIIAGMDLLQRHTFTVLEDHQNRISGLEKKLANN